MDSNTWKYELSLFSEDLIANLLNRHPVLCTLPHKLNVSRHFPDEVGNSVLLAWRERRNELDQNLNRDFPAFLLTEHYFKQYLKRLVDVEIRSERDVIRQILGLSATLFEILLFMHRKGITHFVPYASKYLFFMLSNVKAQEFYEEGGWSTLESVSAKLSKDYDEEIFKQYISENVCSISASDETEESSIDSNLECQIQTLKQKDFQPDCSMSQKTQIKIYSADEKETLTEVTEKHYQEFVSTLNKPEYELKKETSEEVTPKVKKENSQDVSVLNKPDELEKDQKSEEITPGEVKESSEATVSALNKPNELEKDSTNEVDPNEVADKKPPELLLIFNRSEDEPKKYSTNKELTPDEIKEKHAQGTISTVNKPEDESKNDFTNKIAPNEEKISPESVIVFHEPGENPNKNSTKADSILSEATTETKSPNLKQPNILREEPLIKFSCDLTDIESNESILEFVKTNECLKTAKLSSSPTSVHQDVSVSEKEIQLTDSSTSTLMLTAPEINSESVKEISPTEERKPSPVRKISGEYTTDCTVDFTKPGDCSSESTETSPIDCELTKEVDKFLIEEITTHFQVRFLSEEEIEAINWFSEDNGKKDSNVPVLKQDEAIQADLVSSNNQNIPTLVNLAQTAMLEKNQIPAEHASINNATKIDQSLFKSPKPESNKEATPNKANTPSAGKGSIKDTRNKTDAFNQNQNATPIKTLTGTPKPSVSSTGRNVIEEKTPKKLKSNSAASKSSSPYFKTPTDKGISKLKSKSCEKTERNQNLSAAKASAEITESLPKFASATVTKSRRFSDSCKSLPIVVQPKSGDKDPSNNLKSSSIVSESIPKGKVTATDIPIASEKRKSTNPKSENCQKSDPREKTAGSSSAKSTDQSENKTLKRSEEFLDARSCKEYPSSIKKRDQNKGNEPPKAPAKSTVVNTVRRTRNVHEKNASSDPKSEKPRWR